MTNRFLIVLLSAFLIQSCGSGSDSGDNNQIDYATIDSLQTQVVMEIGETDDYLPGQLTSLVVTSNGDILVADWAGKTIEQFDSEGNHRATIAKEGNGPGEVGNYFSLRLLWNDTLLVSQSLSQRDFFVPDNDGIYRFDHSQKSSEATERSFSIIANHSDSSYYASEIQVFTPSLNEGENEDYRQAPLMVVNSSGELLQDSVQTYKQGNWLVERSSNSIRVRSIPFRHEDDLAMVGNGDYLIARVDSNAIFRYSSNHELMKKIPLNVAERPITSDDLAYELDEDLDPSTRNKLEARIGDFKPPYLNVYATEDYIWLHTNTSEAGKEMVVIDYEGNPVGKFMLPEVDSIEEIRGNSLYTIHESPEVGHLIRKYEIDLP